MTIEEHVFAALSVNAGVLATAPADRIKPPGNWQGLARDYIVHFPTSPDPIRTHEGRSALTRWNAYQVSCFSDSYSGARSLAKAVVAALDGQHGGVNMFWNGERYLYENDVRVHHISLDFEVFEAL